LPIASTTSPTAVHRNCDHRKALAVGLLDAQHRKIGAGILEHDIDGKFALVGERNLDLVGAVDDVIVGDDQA
jgi:hypothetical protein